MVTLSVGSFSSLGSSLQLTVALLKYHLKRRQDLYYSNFLLWALVPLRNPLYISQASQTQWAQNRVYAPTPLPAPSIQAWAPPSFSWTHLLKPDTWEHPVLSHLIPQQILTFLNWQWLEEAVETVLMAFILKGGDWLSSDKIAGQNFSILYTYTTQCACLWTHIINSFGK